MEDVKRPKSEVLKVELGGLLRLEWYEDRGFVVTIQVDKNKFFFIEFAKLKEIVDDFSEIIRLKGNRP